MHSLANRADSLVVRNVTESMATSKWAAVFPISDLLLKHRRQIKRFDISAHHFHALCLTKFNRGQFCFNGLYKAVPVHPRDLAVEFQNVHVEGMLTSWAYFGRLDTRYSRQSGRQITHVILPLLDKRRQFL